MKSNTLTVIFCQSGMGSFSKIYNFAKIPQRALIHRVPEKLCQPDDESLLQKMLSEARLGNTQGLMNALSLLEISENALRSRTGGRQISRNQFDLAVQHSLKCAGITLDNEVRKQVFDMKRHSSLAI